jgi:hypothetical protein
MFPATTQRLSEHTPPEINEQIRNATWQHVYQYAAAPEAIAPRLAKLEREWDIERMMELSLALLALIGLGLTVLISRWFIVLPILVAAFQFTHAVQGWNPLLAVMRRWGFRTQTEIDQERYALKALRGDFRAVGDPSAPPADRAAQAFLAAQG